MRKLLNAELNRFTPDQYHQSDKIPVVVVLDNIRSHLNVGSVFRTADAFAIQGICLCGITGTPPHRDIFKTALGATETVHWQYFEHTLDAIHSLRSKGCQIVSVEQAIEAVMLQDFTVNRIQPIAMVFGNEVDGVAQEVVSASDKVIEIPQYGTKHSLNIAVAAGVVLWHIGMEMRRRS
jgi:tRNA G18 (ribose-2'-O)-methylase SpoU